MMNKDYAIIQLLKEGKSYTQIQFELSVSPSKISMIKKRYAAEINLKSSINGIPSATTTTTTTKFMRDVFNENKVAVNNSPVVVAENLNPVIDIKHQNKQKEKKQTANKNIRNQYPGFSRENMYSNSHADNLRNNIEDEDKRSSVFSSSDNDEIHGNECDFTTTTTEKKEISEYEEQNEEILKVRNDGSSASDLSFSTTTTELKENTTTKKNEPTTTTEVRKKWNYSILYIKRYIEFHNTVVTQIEINFLIISIQDAIEKRWIRKDDPYADEIMTIQNQLIKCYNRMDKKIKITIVDEALRRYREIIRLNRNF